MSSGRTEVVLVIDTDADTGDLRAVKAEVVGVAEAAEVADTEVVGFGKSAESAGDRVEGLGDEAEGAARDVKAAGDAAASSSRQMELLGKAAKWAIAGLAAGGIAAAGFGLKSVMMASDVSESQNKVNVVFGESAHIIDEFAADSAMALGMSRGEALEASGTYGNLLVAMGLNEEAAAGMSTEIVQLAADLGSFNNLPTADVLEKLRAGLVGEAEPLKALGVNLNQARIEAKALEMGLVEVTYTHTVAEGAAEKLAIAQEKHAGVVAKYGAESLEARESQLRLESAQRKTAGSVKESIGELDAGAKAQAAWALIQEDSTKAAGDFERTAASSLPNAAKQIKAMAADGMAALGDALLPVAQDVVTMFRDAMPGAIDTAKQFINTTLIPAIDDVRNALGLAEEQSASYNERMLLTGEASGEAGTEQSELYETLVEMRDMWDENKEAVQGALEAIQDILGWIKDNKQIVVNFIAVLALFKAGLMIGGAVNAAVTALKAYQAAMATGAISTGVMRTAIQLLLGSTGIGLLLVLIGVLYMAWTQNWGDIQGKTDKAVKKIVGFFKNLKREWDRLVDKFKSVDLSKIGEDIMTGLKDGMDYAWEIIKGWVAEKIEALPAIIKQFFGIESPSRLMMEIGRLIMEGLALGIRYGGQLPLDAMREAINDLMGLRSELDQLRSEFETVWADVNPQVEVKDWDNLEQRMEAYRKSLEETRRKLKESHDEHLDQLDKAASGSQKEWYVEAIEVQKDNAKAAYEERMKQLDDEERRLEEVYETWVAGAEAVEEAHDRAVEAIERAQEGAENYAERVNEAVMQMLEDEAEARKAAYDAAMAALDDLQDAEDKRHKSVMDGLKKERETWQKHLTDWAERISDLKLDLATLEVDLNIPAELERLALLQGKLAELKTVVDSLQVFGPDSAREREQMRKSQAERIRLTTQEQREMLEASKHLFSGEQLRSIELLLAGYSQRASTVRDLFAEIERDLGGQIGAQQSIIDAKQAEIDKLKEHIANEEYLLKIEQDRVQTILEGIAERERVAEEFHNAETARIDGLKEAERDAYDAWKDNHDLRVDAERDRHQQRMADIAAEFAYELALLDHSQEEIDALVREAQRIAEEIGRRAAEIYGQSAKEAERAIEQTTQAGSGGVATIVDLAGTSIDETEQATLTAIDAIAQGVAEFRSQAEQPIAIPIRLDLGDPLGAATGGEEGKTLAYYQRLWQRAQSYAGKEGFRAAGFADWMEQWFPGEMERLQREGTGAAAGTGIFAPLVTAAIEASSVIQDMFFDPLSIGLTTTIELVGELGEAFADIGGSGFTEGGAFTAGEGFTFSGPVQAQAVEVEHFSPTIQNTIVATLELPGGHNFGELAVKDIKNNVILLDELGRALEKRREGSAVTT